MIKAILFDLDETLIIDHPVNLHTLRSCAYLVASWYSIEVEKLVKAAEKMAIQLWKTSPVHEYTERIGHSAGEGLWARYEEHTSPAIEKLHSWAPLYRVAVWREALSQQGIEDDALAEELAHKFFKERRVFPRYPEVDELLRKLSDNYKIGIVTNGVPDLQKDKLDGCGLRHWVSGTVISGECNVGKPDKRIFEFICQQLGVAPSECVMVGDNPERDIAGANNAGMKSVWIERGLKLRDPQHDASAEVQNLLDMLHWLDEWQEQS